MPKRDDITSVPGDRRRARSSSARPASSTTPAPRPAGVLKAEGLRVILVNSNPATIMTDPEFADATYVEPITRVRREGHRRSGRTRSCRPSAVRPRSTPRSPARARAGEVRRRDDRRQLPKPSTGREPRAVQRDRQKVGGEVAPPFICHTMEDVEKAAAELGCPSSSVRRSRWAARLRDRLRRGRPAPDRRCRLADARPPRC